MRLNVYSIFDTATGAYMRPFFLQSDGQAMRLFCDIAMDAEHEVGKHPEDYHLARLGVWNDQDAQYSPEKVSTLITGLQAVAASRQVPPGQVDIEDGGMKGA